MSSPSPKAQKLSPAAWLAAQKSTNINGHNYSYAQFLPPSYPSTPLSGTVFLIHGFPDLAFGWRYQIPTLLSLNLQIIVPDMLGYAKTSAPSSPTHYTYKRIAADLHTLAEQLNVAKEGIILGGHDWGGAVVYRVALWYPQLVKGIFSICTPFTPPASPGVKFVHPAKILPNFQYQLQFAGPDVEREVVGKDMIRGFLNSMYGGKLASKKPTFTVKGVPLGDLLDIKRSSLLSAEEMDFYVDQYAINGMQGPLNWYRTSEMNFNDEQAAGFKRDGPMIEVPTLFVGGRKDAALPPAMSRGMERWFEKGKVEMREVDTNHWALWQKPEEVNDLIVGWFGREFGIEEGKAIKAKL